MIDNQYYFVNFLIVSVNAEILNTLEGIEKNNVKLNVLDFLCLSCFYQILNLSKMKVVCVNNFGNPYDFFYAPYRATMARGG